MIITKWEILKLITIIKEKEIKYVYKLNNKHIQDKLDPKKKNNVCFKLNKFVSSFLFGLFKLFCTLFDDWLIISNNNAKFIYIRNYNWKNKLTKFIWSRIMIIQHYY